MPDIKILIHRCDKKEPAIDYPAGAYIGQSQALNAVLIEQGMESGDAIVAFDIVLPEGKRTIVQLSESIFNAIGSALKGAKDNWKENPVPNVWKK